MTRIESKSEFDSYAQEYRRLLKHPIRDLFAPDGLFFHRRKLELIRDFLTEQGKISAQLRWLDVGCGQGELLRLGSKLFREVAGCDPSSEMLALCQDLPIRQQLNEAEIPFNDQSFDLVTLVCVLHHASPDTRVSLVAEAHRVLRPDGWLCIIEHNPRNPVTRHIVRLSPIDQHARLVPVSLTAELMHQHGFEQSEISYFLYVPEALYRWLGRIEKPLARIPWGGQYAVFARPITLKSNEHTGKCARTSSND